MFPDKWFQIETWMINVFEDRANGQMRSYKVSFQLTYQ